MSALLTQSSFSPMIMTSGLIKNNFNDTVSAGGGVINRFLVLKRYPILLTLWLRYDWRTVRIMTIITLGIRSSLRVQR